MYQSRFGLSRDERLPEPRVLVRSVVGHEIEQHLHAAAVRRREQLVEVLQRAEQRVDLAVIGDVVAEIGHRRAEDRRQPDRVDAEFHEVIEPAQDARQVADAVAVGVLERRG